MTSHSDRELMKMSLNALEEAWEYGYTDPTVLNALRDRLAKPEWIGLTEDEAIELLPVGDWEIESTLDFAKAIDAKLKEKNS